MHPVRADHEIVLGGGPVVELHPHDAIRRRDGPHRDTPAHGHLVRTRAQHVVQGGAAEADTGPDPAPRRLDVDVEQQPPGAVEEALPADGLAAPGHLAVEAEQAEGPQGAAGQVHAGAGLLARGPALDHLDRAARARQRARAGEPGDAGAHDQDPARGTVHSAASRLRAGRCGWSGRGCPGRTPA